MRITKILPDEKPCGLYEVYINGIKADVRSVRVSAYPYNCGWPGRQRPEEQSEEAGLVSFECELPAEIFVVPKRKFEEAVLRPLSKEVSLKREGGGLRFVIDRYGQYSLETDGHHGNLHIFADRPEKYDRDGVIYYGPGAHRVGAKQLFSGQRVVIDRDAVVFGGFYAVDADNVRIEGKGVIDGSWETRTGDTLLLAVDVKERKKLPRDEKGFLKFMKETSLTTGAIKLYNCRNCFIEGVTCVDSSTWVVACYACSELHIDNIKEVGQWKYNTDGIDLINCHDATVKNSFLRNFDDCMVLKGIQGWDDQNVYGIKMSGLTVWCDWGRSLEIGAETCADEYHDILFEDCDVIHSAYSACDIQNGDRAYVHNVTFRNIRVEYTKHQQQDVFQTDMSVPYGFPPLKSEPRLALIHGYTGQWSDAGIPGRTEKILFENITVYPDGEIGKKPVIDLEGYCEGHGIEDVVFEGVFLNGTRLKAADPEWKKGSFVGKTDFI